MPVTDPDAVLEGIDPEQREVARALTGAVCVHAGAGTGKTRAITHRLAYGVASGVYKPQQVLALTFTARAAGEMRTRLHGLGVAGVQARTFHAAALRQLQFFWPRAIGGAPPPLADHKAPLVAEAASRLRINPDRSVVRDLSAEIEWAKVNLITPEHYPQEAQKGARNQVAGQTPATIARLLQTYEDVKTSRGVIDFEDVLLIMCGILDDHPQIAGEIRQQYRHFVVDEFQDVSALQHRLLTGWLGGRHELCVVGDPSQTIYSFAGADPNFLLGFTSLHPGARTLQLVRDYRSTPQVVALANRLLDAAPPAARPARVELIAQRTAGPAPEFVRCDDDLVEAEEVVGRIKKLLRQGENPDEIAVLYRTNAQSEPLEAALSAASIGYQVRGGERFFARSEVRRAVMLLRGAARADQTSGSADGAALGDSVRDVITAAGWSPEAPSETGAVRDRWESLQALAVLADDLAARGPATLAEFVTELDARAASAHAPSAGGVTLSSLHAAKGLEWDTVIIVGLSEGLLPITFATTRDEVEEERRLLYVGVTRARERLVLTWAASRGAGGRANRNPSRFIADLGGRSDRRVSKTVPTKSEKRSKAVLHTTCRVCGTGLGPASERKIGRCSDCPPDHDELLFDALKAWRSDQASTAKVPAYVVFTDATLEAIAYAKPRSDEELLRVSGVGAMKLTRYGADVLAIVTGGQPTSAAPPNE